MPTRVPGAFAFSIRGRPRAAPARSFERSTESSTGRSRRALARAVRDGAQVLGQARAAEGEAGLQVVGRQVELGVRAEQVHHLVAVDALASCRGLPISLANATLSAWKALFTYLSISAVRIGDHRRPRPSIARVQRAHRRGAGLVADAEHGDRRARRSRRPRCPRAGTRGCSRRRSPARTLPPEACSSRGTSRSSTEPGSIVLRNTTTVASAAAPRAPRRPRRRRARRASRSSEPSSRLGVPTQTSTRSASFTAATKSVVAVRRPSRAACGDEVAQVLLDDRALAAGEAADLVLVRVDADDVVAEFREARRRHRTDVPQTEDCDAHALSGGRECRHGRGRP